MRIISNNKTDNYSNYIERKRGIINYNSILTERPIIFNKNTNNFKINYRNQIVKRRSYDLANNINKIKPYFNNKCWPNNNKPNKTLDLTNGQISIFDYDNSINLQSINGNDSNINIFSQTTDLNCNNLSNTNIYFNNINHIIKNNFINQECILNFLIKNLSDPTCPTSLNLIASNISFNKLFGINGENSNTFVDKENILKFENIERHNVGVFYGFTLSGETLQSSQVKQFDRINLSISNELINIEYITYLLYKNTWTINNINFNAQNSNKNFSNNTNSVIYPEYNYKFYNYFMQFENNDICIKYNSDGSILIETSFNTPYPLRSQVNNEFYNITLNSVNKHINSNELNLLSTSLIDISYHNLKNRYNRENYNIFFLDSSASFVSSILNFKIDKIYKIFIGKSNNIEEYKAGIDLSGNLCNFNFNIKDKDGIILSSFNETSNYITGYDTNFYSQSNNSIISSSGNLDISLSHSLDIANYSPNLQTNRDKIRNYYLGIDICNIQIKNLPISDLKLSTLVTSDICLNNKFTLNIIQTFIDNSQFNKSIEFIVNKLPEQNEKIDICGEINFFSPPNPIFFNIGKENENYFFGIAYLDIKDLCIKFQYDISLTNFNNVWLYGSDAIGCINVNASFDYSFNNIVTSTINFDGSNIIYISNPSIDNSFVIETLDTCINNITSSLSESEINSINSLTNPNARINYFLSISSEIIFDNHPFYNFSEPQIIYPTPNPREFLGNSLLLNPSINNPINNFNNIFNYNFPNLVLCNPGDYNIINSYYPNWENFEDSYNHIQTLNEGQLLWSTINRIPNQNINGFVTKNNDPNPYINHTNYFGNNNNNFELLENSGNYIISRKIDNHYEIATRFYSVPKTIPETSSYFKFITLKIDLIKEVKYEHHVVLIEIQGFNKNTKNYENLELGKDFIMYMCEFNSFYNNIANGVGYSGFNGRTAWLNCSKLYDLDSQKYTAGLGCYNYTNPKYTIKPLTYEIFIPHLISRSSSAIYFKIGLNVNSTYNLCKINYKLPPIID